MSDNQTPDKPTRADIARANGAKSNGPKTSRGKAISSRNATRHGLTARQVVLPEESALSYRALVHSFVDYFRPQSVVELELISTMAATRWRLRRLVSIETNLLTHELEQRSDLVSRYVQNPDKDKTLAWTFDRISGGTSLSLLPRYEATLHRNFDRALKQFQSLRGQPKVPPANRTQAPDPTA